MKVLVVGSGGREHALTWRLSRSPSVGEVLVAPGNPGMVEARRLPIRADDIDGLVTAAKTEAVDLVVIGPDAALEAGLADALIAAGVSVFGPTRAAAELEWSKGFAKALCAEVGAPTAAFAVFDDAVRAKAHLAALSPPYVLKADGLALGKGVIIADSLEDAHAAIDSILGGRFGAAGARLIVEEFMAGEEVSLFVLCDGVRAVVFGDAQDHKRAFDGDAGPNTGGMGAYSPAPVATPAVVEAAMATIVRPVLTAMAARGRPFRGVLFAGLMVTADGPKLVEFNARFGDPETQALMVRFEGDLGALLLACAQGRLDQAPAWSLRPGAAAAVVLAADGYPDEPVRGSIIAGLPAAAATPGVTVFHAGTQRDDQGLWRADGGRVLAVVGEGDTLRAAVSAAYAGVDAVDWPGGFHRRDIAWRALARG